MKLKCFLIAIAILIFILVIVRFAGQRLQPRSPVSKISGAYQALEFWTAQRAYPAKVMPDVGHYEAYRLARMSLKQASSAQPWRSIGPDNIGGRTLAVVFNPQNPHTIYAGSASGGLWRSRSSGVGPSAWEQVDTSFPILGVAAIAIAPDDSNTIYIGTGEVYGYQSADIGLGIRTTRGSYGIGILKSTDGGETWTKSLDWSYAQKRGVWAIEINPLNADVVWAGTTEGTFKSTNAGATWERVDTTLMVMDLIVHPVDTNTVFIACGNLGSPGGGLYRTVDGGHAWAALTEGLPLPFGGKPQLAMYRSSPNVIFVSLGGGYWSGAGTALCRSVDNGDTWRVLSTEDYSTYQGWYSHLVGVHPEDSSQVICAGIELWKSTTGGTHLVQKSHSINVHGTPPPGGPEGPADYIHVDIHSITYHPIDPDIIYFGTDGGVFRSLDGGNSFEGCNGGYQTTQFYNGFSSSATDTLLAMGGLQDNYTAIYEGSPSWRRCLYGDGAWTAMHQTNANIMYGSYQYLGTIYKSTNRGYDWISLPRDFMGSINFVAPFIICQSDPSICYAGTSYMYKSVNAGQWWFMVNNNSQLDGNPVLSLAASASNSNVVYAATAPISTRAHVYRTTGGGTTWEDITGELPDRYPVDIAVDPTDDLKVYIVFSGFGTSHIFTSTFGGYLWENIGSGLPDVPTSAVAVDPLYPDHIYVGNDLGVFVSTDRGTSWSSFNEGLPEAVIAMDLSISPANRKIRVATHGNGAYERPLLEPSLAGRERQAPLIAFELFQNYPNPFNQATTISFRLETAGMVNLSVYNVAGQLVTTLVDGEMPAGLHSIEWQAREMASGVYFSKLTAGQQTAIKKCVIAR